MSVFQFYHAQYNPTGLSGLVGGTRSNTEINPKLGELFCNTASYEDTAVTQYRKLFVKQEETATIQNLYLDINEVEYTGQIAFAYTRISGNTAASPVDMPSGMSGDNFSGNSATPLFLTGTSVASNQYEIWLRLTVPSGAGSDNMASFNLRAKGARLN